MKIITEVFKLESIQPYIDSGVTTLMVTTPFLSAKYPESTSIEKLKAIVDVAKRAGCEVALLINRLIMEKEWHQFEQEIDHLKMVEFDYFVVHDLGVMFTLKQKFSKVEIIFHSDTTMANALDIDFLLHHGADVVAVARELTHQKKLNLVEKFHNKLMLSLFGHQVMSTSYRPLLTNYFQEIQKDIKIENRWFKMREQQRSEFYLALEDQHGFHMFTGEIISALKHLQTYKEHDLGFAYIDSAFLPESLVCLVAQTIKHGYDHQTFLKAFNQLNLDKTIGEGLLYTDTTNQKEEAL